MSKFFISGFADEIDSDFKVQLSKLKALNIRYIEIRGVSGKNISDINASEAKEISEQMNQNGIKPSAIGSPIGKIGIKDDFISHLDKFKRVLETAITLESPYIRIFSFFIPKNEDANVYRDEVMNRLQRIIEVNNGSGVTLLHENEKGIFGDIPERCLDIHKTFEKDGLLAIFDPANYIQCGCETFPKAFDMLKPYVKYIHIKDALASGEVVPAGYGVGRVADILKTLKNEGYEGFLSLEPHLGSFTGLAELENTDLANKLPKSGFDKFEIAHNALTHILDII